MRYRRGILHCIPYLSDYSTLRTPPLSHPHSPTLPSLVSDLPLQTHLRLLPPLFHSPSQLPNVYASIHLCLPNLSVFGGDGEGAGGAIGKAKVEWLCGDCLCGLLPLGEVGGRSGGRKKSIPYHLSISLPFNGEMYSMRA